MPARQFHGLLAVALLATVLGCARSGRSGDQTSVYPEITTARITNNGWLDVNVYASRAGSRQRLGTVAGQNTETFRVPHDLIDARGVRIFIDAIGSPQSYQTEYIPVTPGQQINVVVQHRLGMSHYSVFNR